MLIDHESRLNRVLRILIGLAVIGFLVFVGGYVTSLLTSDASGANVQTVEEGSNSTNDRTYTREAVLEAIRKSYRENGVLPGRGERIVSTNETPTKSQKYRVAQPPESSRELWNELSFPEPGDEVLFQLIYEANANGTEGTLEIRHDFNPGGGVHTVRTPLRVKDGELKVLPIEAEHRLE